ncbi:MAG: DNA double-strand break repair nuclease NurA [Candidatus Hodarchaeota archaeon]
MPIDDEFELVSLEESLKRIQLGEEVKEIRKKIKYKTELEWARDKGLDDKDLTEEDQKDEEDNLPTTIEESKPICSIEANETYFKNNFTVVAFDESSFSITGTYAKLVSLKFGECHQTPDGNRWNIKQYAYRPTLVYLEDSSQKITIYKMGIRKFVETIYNEFITTSLKTDAKNLSEWYEEVFVPKMDDRLENKKYKLPTLPHVVDRLRTADELLRSILRMKELIEKNERKYIFLGDGISAFRQHIFPPKIFVNFFLNFIKKYNISYYTYSKTCRLRDKQGRFFLPIYREMFPKKTLFIPIPQDYTRSLTFLVRLQQERPILRFDVPEYYNEEQALEIHKNLIPYSPLGYPIALSEAHNATALFAPEFFNFNTKFLEIKIDPKTKQYIDELRSHIFPD